MKKTRIKNQKYVQIFTIVVLSIALARPGFIVYTVRGITRIKIYEKLLILELNEQKNFFF